MTAALEGSEWSAARPCRTLPPGKTRYPLYRRLCGPQGRSGQAENLVPTGFRSRTVQPVAQSLYRLSYPAHIVHIVNLINVYVSDTFAVDILREVSYKGNVKESHEPVHKYKIVSFKIYGKYKTQITFFVLNLSD